jgi:hypothetical protein
MEALVKETDLFQRKFFTNNEYIFFDDFIQRYGNDQISLH